MEAVELMRGVAEQQSRRGAEQTVTSADIHSFLIYLFLTKLYFDVLKVVL